jgi:DNA-directed RNA polymerase beta' subunit
VLDLAERPEKLIVTHLVVPPVAVRPSVEMDSAAGRWVNFDMNVLTLFSFLHLMWMILVFQDSNC